MFVIILFVRRRYIKKQNERMIKMNRDIFIKNLTGDRIKMSPKGRCANELTVEEFEKDTSAFSI